MDARKYTIVERGLSIEKPKTKTRFVYGDVRVSSLSLENRRSSTHG